MEFLRTPRRKTLMSEIAYYALNIGLVAVLLAAAVFVQSLPLNSMLALLSKWRVLAVRPRYWLANIQSNMVDVIVGMSVAVLLYVTGGFIVLQLIIGVLYAVWLIGVKPLSKRQYMILQAGVAIGAGSLALFSIGYTLPNFVVVLFSMVLGYSTARHALQSYHEEQLVLLSMVWAVVFGEIGWLASQWTMAYALPGQVVLKLPQATIIMLLVSAVGGRAYHIRLTRKKLLKSDIIGLVLFSIAVIVAMFLFANSVKI
ncbi:MAG: hypothetical protein Q4A34_02465 [Candidatus Saccharibacteria bacterium]|nr:hypothetical protein [Candidatus Saccharibacteria bacterium]